LFDGSTGALLRTFNNPTPAAGDNFGFSVAAVGNNVLVGAIGDNTGGDNSGAAYVFDGSTGALLRTYFNPTPAGFDSFGHSVAAVGNNVLVGAPGDNTGGDNSGAAYLFDGSSGALLHTFNNPTRATLDLFGWSVAAVGNNVLVGVPADTTGGISAGAVHLIDGTSYDMPAGNGPNDMTLVTTGVTFDIIDNYTGEVVYSQLSSAGAIIIAGAEGEADTLRVTAPAKFGKPIHFFGGAGAEINDHLRIDLNVADATYAPTANAPGAGSFGAGATRWLSFGAVESAEVSGVINFSLLTPSSSDVIQIDPGLGTDDDPAMVISGTSGGAPITPLTLYDATNVIIDAAARDRVLADDRVVISADLIAQGLKNLTIHTGKGRDELEIAATSYDLPVEGGKLLYNAGLGLDKIIASADVDMTLTNTALTLSGSGNGMLHLLFAEEGSLVGDSGDNVLDAKFFIGNVTLSGKDGDDVLIAGAGHDLLLGGDGDDRLFAGNGNNILQGGDGDDSLFSGIGADVLDGGEGNNILDAGAGNDILRSGAGNDSLSGGLGNDLLEAGDGNDWLDGGAGNDRLFGDFGDDQLFGGTGNDLLDAGAGNDNADGGAGNDSISGGAGNDVLIGGTGNDALSGDDGDDALFGNDGNDWLIGGLGFDFFDGGLGTNFLEGEYIA
jgi:Ca2+-binding RTX toxin-like protein